MSVCFVMLILPCKVCLAEGPVFVCHVLFESCVFIASCFFG